MKKPVELVLAIYPNARGFAFVLFEGEHSLVDWGISEAHARKRGERSLRQIDDLIQRFRPDIVVLREEAKWRHGILFLGTLELAERRGTLVVAISRKQVRRAFPLSTKSTRRAIVAEIIRRLPILRSFDPGPRKIWNSENRHMSLFDASALALAFFAACVSQTAIDPFP